MLCLSMSTLTFWTSLRVVCQLSSPSGNSSLTTDGIRYLWVLGVTLAMITSNALVLFVQHNDDKLIIVADTIR